MRRKIVYPANKNKFGFWKCMEIHHCGGAAGHWMPVPFMFVSRSFGAFEHRIDTSLMRMCIYLRIVSRIYGVGVRLAGLVALAFNSKL